MDKVLITKEEQRLSVEHYDQMIKWVESTRDLNDKTHIGHMETGLDEQWLVDYSILCQTYECETCPLTCAGYGCEDETKPGYQMYSSETWSEWLKHAKQLRNVLASLETRD
jgi:hypothetical protein